MRRKDREVTEFDALLDIVRRCDVCRLAIPHEPLPYLVPLNFGEEVVGNTLYLYFHSAQEGTKLDLLRQHPQVTFEMDCGHQLVLNDEKMSCTMAYESIIGWGKVDFCANQEKVHGLDIIMRHYHAEDFPYSQAPIPQTTVLRLKVEAMTGKHRRAK